MAAGPAAIRTATNCAAKSTPGPNSALAAARLLPRADEQHRRVRPAHHALGVRSEEHTSELQSHVNLVCRLLLEKKNSTRHALQLDAHTYCECRPQPPLLYS